ncbi:MAG: hypothetical protein QGH33_20665, partial [Pirellulaceae bacterium]|nr:hypothetical protein [Pirellulaceae bacterium]
KNVNTLPGIDQIRIPGQRAAKQRRHRQEAGIPLDSATCRNLRSVLDSLGLADKYRDVLGDPS